MNSPVLVSRMASAGMAETPSVSASFCLIAADPCIGGIDNHGILPYWKHKSQYSIVIHRFSEEKQVCKNMRSTIEKKNHAALIFLNSTSGDQSTKGLEAVVIMRTTYVSFKLFGTSVGTDKDNVEPAVGLLGGVVEVDEDGGESLTRWTPRSREIQGNNPGLVGFQGVFRRRNRGTLDVLDEGGAKESFDIKDILVVFVDWSNCNHFGYCFGE
mmetsp:Transcript_7277/g.15050  ORF Transcript_7277/g.15050 Transcript_7277/m.15050 type:complete len:213 (-) Transcript_7277:103-741(-)